MEGVRKISKKYYLRQIMACFLVSCLFFNVPAALAASWDDASVVTGAVTGGTVGNTTTVTMGSDQAVINWDSLDTSASELLQFIKDSGSFAVLNRVTQGGATQFDGTLLGNQGHIIILNPNGVIFGSTAFVQANKLTASALDITNEDFMNGNYQFVAGEGMGAVANYGTIAAQQVALIGKQVLNAGTISSPGGFVLMAAGDKVFLGRDGSDVVVEVTGVTVPAGMDAAEAGLGDVINEGTVEAASGEIVLAAGDTFSRAIDGLDSLSVAVESGTGRVGQFGTLSADGVEGDGGSITLTAADTVALGADSVTTANAGTNGDGGEVIVYSPDTALFRDGAMVEAKGGTESGSGGFFELSGKQYVEIEGQIDMTAANGDSGQFLIDPVNVRIVNGPIAGADDEGQYSGGQWDPIYQGTSGSQLGIDTLNGYLDSADLTITTQGDSGSLHEGWVQFEGSDQIYTDTDHSLTVNADSYIEMKSTSGGIDLAGGGDLTLNAGLTTPPGGDVKILTDSIVHAGGNLTINAAGAITIGSYASCDRDMTLDAETFISLFPSRSLASGGDMTLSANTMISLGGDLSAGTDGTGSLMVTADADGINTTGQDEWTTSLASLYAADDVTINGNLQLGDEQFGGNWSQFVYGGGTVTANGWARKVTEGPLYVMGGQGVSLLHETSGYADPAVSTCEGDLWIYGGGDVQIRGDVTTFGEGAGYSYDYWCRPTGGVAIVSGEGSVYSEEIPTLNGTEKVLNISITGTSDHEAQTGIDLVQFDIATRRTTDWWDYDSYMEPHPRAAILIQSSDNLTIGDAATLTARGNYYSEVEIGDVGRFVVDDRPAIGFLDTDGTIIGGYERDEGQPFDLAIYLASTGNADSITQGNVQLGGEVWIQPCGTENPYVVLGPATVVADAYYNVEFQESFLNYLLDKQNPKWQGEWEPFRMEVCSRVTEWLNQAIANNRLPYAADPAFMEGLLWGMDYVLRGAGLGNAAIAAEELDPEYPGSLGRAWVLEDPPPLAAPLPKYELPRIEGCPALIEAAAAEVGIAKESLQIAIERALAINPNLQPCEACANILDYAAILSDPSGAYMAAMGQVFSEVAPSAAPFTPEMATSITTALAERADDLDMPHYARAMEYVDAFVGYVAALDQLGAPIGDSVELAMTKYGGPVSASDNANMAAYIQSRLAGIGG